MCGIRTEVCTKMKNSVSFNVTEKVQKCFTSACVSVCVICVYTLVTSGALVIGVFLTHHSLQHIHHMKVRTKNFTSCSLLTLRLSMQPSAGSKSECLKPLGRERVHKQKTQACVASLVTTFPPTTFKR